MQTGGNRSFLILAIVIAAVVVGLFAWQPWNANGALWGK
jgi:uncharacterized protein (DUF983 family)